MAGTPRICPGCRSLDGEHTFDKTCTLYEKECDHDYDLDSCRQEGATAIEVWKCNKCGLENEWVVDVDY